METLVIDAAIAKEVKGIGVGPDGPCIAVAIARDGRGCVCMPIEGSGNDVDIVGKDLEVFVVP